MGKKLVNLITCGCDGQKRKDRTTNNDLQSTTQKTKDQTTETTFTSRALGFGVTDH